MKTCFSEQKLMKQFGNPPLSKRTPPPLSTNPPISEQFFHDPLFQKQESPNFRGEETMIELYIISETCSYVFSIEIF